MKRLLFANLPYSMTAAQVKAELLDGGWGVQSVGLVKAGSFNVLFTSEEEGELAYRMLNGTIVHNRKLIANVWTDKPHRETIEPHYATRLFRP